MRKKLLPLAARQHVSRNALFFMVFELINSIIQPVNAVLVIA